jgi:uncharacterized membrane protein YjjP (DUF1212 family)
MTASDRAAEPASDDANRRDIAVQLLLELAAQLHRFGTPSHRLESTMASLGTMLGLDVALFVVPTMIEVAVGRGPDQRSLMLRVEPGAPDLARLEALLGVIERLRTRAIGPADALADVRAIATRPERRRPFVVPAALAGTGAAAAVITGGGLPEVVASAVVCALAGVVVRLVGSHPTRAPLADFLAGGFVAFSAAAAALWFGPLASKVVVLASLIAFLPGLQLATSMNELAMRHLVSGTARFMGALMAFVAIGFGAALGDRAARLLGPSSSVVPDTLPGWTVAPAIALAAVSLGVLYRARTRDLGWVLLGTTLGFVGASIGERMLGPALGVCVGAAVVGLAGNLLARRLPKPSALVILPGITLLVPGSVGFRGLSALMQNDVLSGIGIATTAITIAGSLVAGLLFANALLPSPRGL